MNDDVRILIVDDHALVRGAVSERLQREPGLAVVGTAGTADEAVRKIAACEPDIVLMDIDMPGTICFDAARTIREIRPQTKIIFLSAFTNDQYIDEALSVQASGYVTKREPPERLIVAIREVASGGAYFSAEVQSRIVVDARGARLPANRKSRAATLRPRELEVLRYLARGMTKKVIGEQLGISAKTVDHHTTKLMTKLGIHDRVALARFAIREGLAEA